MARLRRSRLDTPGIRRRRRGKGFSYRWDGGGPVEDPEVLARVRSLAVPPAWTDVWICPWPNGHIQAVGTDAAGRRQYRYHDEWRRQRDAEKFEHVRHFAAALEPLRRQVAHDLASEGYGRDRVAAAAVRLLDVGCFRVGGEEYAEEHETYGVATLRREHVRRQGGHLVFDYPAKGSIRRSVAVDDPEVVAVVSGLLRRRSGPDQLLVHRQGRTWVDLRSDDVNAYIKRAAGAEFSAKDFRTWWATVMAAALLASGELRAQGARSKARTKRAVSAAIREVAEQLGNTPAVCRSSYVDPGVIDRFESGETIREVLHRLGDEPDFTAWSVRVAVEAAVIDLLEPGGREAVAA